MDLLFLGVIIFLFILAVFDLSVGVSNDAVNFMNSALGSKAASYKRIIIVASIGIFIGATMSNGMMDIARHGIFRPEHFSFYDLICIFMAVMVTDIILLDIFNSLGMPTSTTVSMVFELLGATFVVALIKMVGGSELRFHDLLNTEKALSVIIGIFLSVAIAFFFGTVVQFLSRLLFTFDYRCNLKWKIGIFGGICSTAIIYFLLLKGAKDLSFMTPEVKLWISSYTAMILLGCLIFFSLLMQLLHAIGVNVLKTIVLMGTFALAMAFAGNDLVNFIGVPLSGLSSYQDYITNGSSNPKGYMMSSLNGPAGTPFFCLLGAGVIMVVSLASSKKARNVAKTEIGLGSQDSGDEMFGTSRIARQLVRLAINLITWTRRVLPTGVRNWFNRRLNTNQIIIEKGASFDLIRGSVNLVLAGALIALGTSLKLPLSTTFVTFMVAMGTSLADRAWGRESAVFRITGVISVIGGWFITAGGAFIGAGIIVLLMHLGGYWMMFVLSCVTIAIIVRSNRKFNKKKEIESGDAVVQSIISSDNKQENWSLLLLYITQQQESFIKFARDSYLSIAEGFLDENIRLLNKTDGRLARKKNELKNTRRKETLCLRHLIYETAIEKSAWFHLSNNCCMDILYNLRRINEVCREHVDNTFRPLPEKYISDFNTVVELVSVIMTDTITMMAKPAIDDLITLRRGCESLKDELSASYHQLLNQLREADPRSMTVMYVYMNILQETRELISSLRKYLRAYAKLLNSDYKI